MFWALLQERRELLGLDDTDNNMSMDNGLAVANDFDAYYYDGSNGSGGGGGKKRGQQDDKGLWQLAMTGCLLLMGVSCLWVVPALYQRFGTPFLMVAALALQAPTLGIGCVLWRDRRTSELGEVLVTTGVSLTPLTVTY